MTQRVIHKGEDGEVWKVSSHLTQKIRGRILRPGNVWVHEGWRGSNTGLSSTHFHLREWKFYQKT